MRTRSLFVGAFALASAGCFDLRYLSQAAHGQREISVYARPIDEVLVDLNEPEATRALLAHVRQVKTFAELSGLRVTDNYDRYTDLRRPAAVWVVSAAAPLRFESKVWSFPIAGEVPYLGWFKRSDAYHHAEALADAGWDVDVRPAGAYSTLGWFRDPVLSTMLSRGVGSVGDLAEVILHESLHATFYVPGRTGLNESVASFVGETLAVRYLDHAFGSGSKERAAYLRGHTEGAKRAKLLIDARSDLEALYASGVDEPTMIAKKHARLEALRVALGSRFRMNNASLAQWKSYNDGRPELAALLHSCGGDMKRLLARLAPLAKAKDLPPDDEVGAIVKLAGPCER